MRELFDLMGHGRLGPDGRGGFPGNFEGQNAGEPSADFFMNDTVNAFSGVTDEE